MLEALGETDPERIGPYELVGVLGAGGMGRVYLGRTADGARAAVKVIHADLARDADFRKRFGREAASTRGLDAPGIARVVASDPEAERPWLATEYVDGRSLHHVVAERGALSVAEVRALGVGLAEALAAVHAAGLVHRDVKPPNVLLAAAGPQLIDFGIARDVAASTITRTGIAIGTPQFMAPEQLEARRSVGAPADVFALGGVLVFAATGRSPFGEGTPVQLLYAVMHTEPELDDVPAQLRPLLLRCLAKDPDRRPSAAEVAAELAGEPATHQGAEVGGASGAGAGGAGAIGPEPAAMASPTYRAPGDDTTVAGGHRRRRLLALTAGVAAVLAIAGILVDGHASGSDGAHADSRGGPFPTSAVGALVSTSGGDPATPSNSGGATPGASGSGPGAVNSGSPAGAGPVTAATTPKATQTTTAGASHAASSSSSPRPPAGSPSGGASATTTASGCPTTSVPCHAAQQDPTPRYIHLNDSSLMLCLDYGSDVSGNPAGVADQYCTSGPGQWRVWRGTTAGTVQLESAQNPGKCLTSTGSNGAADIAACSETAPDQWFIADASGAWAQLKSHFSPSLCLQVSNFSGLYITRMATCDGSTTWRFAA